MIELKIFCRKMSPGFSLRIFTFYLLICFTSATKKTLRDNSTDPLYSRSIKSVSSYEPSDRELVSVSESFVIQLLDHFETDISKQKTWKQRFVSYCKLFVKENGIFILYLEGEKPISITSIPRALLNWIENLFACYMGLEHRFYGKSQPTGLKYLTVAQALEDTAHFIRFIKTMVSESKNKKWIVVGGSYSGALAAWMRHNYPELVDGAVASSALFPTKPFMPEIYEAVSKIINKATLNKHQYLYVGINIAFQYLHSFMQTNCKKVSNLFKVNIDCTKKNEVSLFFMILTERFFVTLLNNQITHDVFSTMEISSHSKEEDVKRLAEAFDLMMPEGDRRTILKDYENDLKEEQSNDKSTARQYYYQKCTEFGGFETTDSENHPFGHHFDSKFVLKVHCKHIFGKKYNEKKIMKGIKNVNEQFGGLDSEFFQTIFTVGKRDPSKSMQMKKGNGNHVLEIEEASHCQDLHHAKDSDPESLKNARDEVTKLIQKMLNGTIIGGRRRGY